VRLRRLELTRYGHFTGASLTFGAARLHVVLGANEAGKSTALHAIGDALFGFPHSSPWAFEHKGRLCLGFALVAADGTETAFRREKKRGGGLSAEGVAHPEAALARLLGAADRELFERGFGLDAERLRAGAEALVAAKGDAGDSVLAGMGLLHLRAALSRLDEQAKALFGDGRGRRVVTEATKAWKASADRVRDASVRPADWSEAVRDEAACGEAIAALQLRGDLLLAEANRLQRARRVAPRLAVLDRLRGAIAALGEVPKLAPDAPERLDAALAAEAEAERCRLALLRREEARAQQAGDAATLAEAEAIEALGRLAALAAQASADLPAVRRSEAGQRAALAAAAAELLPPLAPEVAAGRIPPEGARRRAEAALTARAERRARIAAAAEAQADAALALRTAEAALAALPEAPPRAALDAALQAARAEGRIVEEVATAGRARATAAEAVRTALAALPLWKGSAEALAAAPVPLAATVEPAGAAWLAARGEARLAAEAREAAERALAGTVARLAGLEAAGLVPTAQAIRAARAARDTAWRAFRDATPDASAPRFEALRDAADRLADQALAEAARVAEHALLRGAREEQEQRLAEAAAVAAERAAAAARAGAAWRAIWAPVVPEPGEPAEMLEWTKRRAEVLERHAALAMAAEREAALRERLAAAEAPLAALLPAAPPGLAARLAAGEAAAAAAEARREAAERVAEARQALAEAQDKAARLAAAPEPGFSESLAALGLPPDASEAALGGVLGAWRRIAEAAPLWRSEADRVARMEAALAEFAAASRALALRLGEEEALPPGVIAARLAARLQQARDAAAAAKLLEEQLAQAREEHDAALGRAAIAAAALAALAEAAGVTGTEALRRAVADADALARLRATLAAEERSLAAEADGFDEAALRAQLAGLDLDAIPGRLMANEAEQRALGPERERLTERRVALRARLAAMAAGQDAGAAAQEAANHLAAAREAAERYARLHAARVLLGAAIERLRAERQGPLLRAAGAHLAALTGGRYTRLDVEEEAGGAALRTIRADGAARLVGELSEGTRDQLHLALRMAAIEAQAQGARTLPFIADDLLVNFDDERAAAALAALAALGRTTQVILFTHHAHIAALAQAVPGAEVLRL
jgi:uncharacterized protein YhaN